MHTSHKRPSEQSGSAGKCHTIQSHVLDCAFETEGSREAHFSMWSNHYLAGSHRCRRNYPRRSLLVDRKMSIWVGVTPEEDY